LDTVVSQERPVFQRHVEALLLPMLDQQVNDLSSHVVLLVDGDRVSIPLSATRALDRTFEAEAAGWMEEDLGRMLVDPQVLLPSPTVNWMVDAINHRRIRLVVGPLAFWVPIRLHFKEP
jgi:hypothetical protein